MSDKEGLPHNVLTLNFSYGRSTTYQNLRIMLKPKGLGGVSVGSMDLESLCMFLLTGEASSGRLPLLWCTCGFCCFKLRSGHLIFNSYY